MSKRKLRDMVKVARRACFGPDGSVDTSDATAYYAYCLDPALHGLDPSTWLETTRISSIKLQCEFKSRGETYAPTVIIRNDISRLNLTLAEYERRLLHLLKSCPQLKSVDLISKLKSEKLIIARSLDGAGVSKVMHRDAEPRLENRRLSGVKIEYSIRIAPLSHEYKCTCGRELNGPQAYMKHRSRCNTAQRSQAINPSVYTRLAEIDPVILFDILNKYGLIEWRAHKYMAIPTSAARQYIDLANDEFSGSTFGATPAQRLTNIIEAAIEQNSK